MIIAINSVGVGLAVAILLVVGVLLGILIGRVGRVRKGGNG